MKIQEDVRGARAALIRKKGDDMNDWITHLEQKFELDLPDIRTYSPLTLAYIGDGIYELIIRTVLVTRGNIQVKRLHQKASSIVKATTQAAMIEYLTEYQILTEEEETVYRRGRNAYSPTRAKNASMSEYRKATGFEALMGYLYLKKEMQRLIDLIQISLEGTEHTI